MLAGDVVGDTLVPRAQQMDVAVAHQHAAGAECPRSGGPEAPDPGDVAGVRLASDDEDVDVGALHLGEDALAAGGAQGGIVGHDLRRRFMDGMVDQAHGDPQPVSQRVSYGSYG